MPDTSKLFVTASDALRTAALEAGVPEVRAEILADTGAGVAKGALFDDGGALSRLIGRPTTPLTTTITEFMQGGRPAVPGSPDLADGPDDRKTSMRRLSRAVIIDPSMATSPPRWRQAWASRTRV